MQKRKMRKGVKVLLIVLGSIVGLCLLVAIAGLLFLSLWPSVGKMPGKKEQEAYAKKSELYYDKKFHNEIDFTVMTGKQDTTSDRKVPKEQLKAVNPTYAEHGQEGGLVITWIGHSSVLLQLGTTNILIDPVLGNRSSPVSFVGPKRFSECPVTAESLPEIDVLFVSHDHYDHLEYGTIKDIDAKVKRYVVPLGVDVILKGWGVSEDKITALNWWEEVTWDGVTYALTPSLHYTGRNPLKGNSTLWGGLFVNDGAHKVYYTGDGGYYDVFSRVYEKYGEVDLMLGDSGQYDTAWATTHMFPEQTAQAAIDAHAKWLIPVHWGTFSLANHAWDDPIIRVASAAETKGVNLATPRHGQTIDFAEISVSTEHWWEDNRRTMEGKALKLRIGETEVSVEWEDNESVKALQALVADKPLTISMSMYGGFEQVGSLGTVLPRQDKEITTEAGDIVLYSGNQIVVFYGSNSWAYTKLGKITDRTASEMKDLLGNGNVSITISTE